MVTQNVIAQTLVELADTLVADFDVVELFNLLTERCCEAFAVDDAGLMLAAAIGAELRLMASSSMIMRDLELYELQAREGPCLDCYRTGHPVTNEALDGVAPRWPHFAPAALDAGFQVVTAIPMRLRGTTIGALNLFRTDRAPISENDLTAAQAFADVATIAILQHQAALDAQRVNEQLHGALNSRVIIEQAKGVLAERADLGVDESFELLRNHARRHRLRIAVVAEGVITGKLSVEEMTRPPSA